MKMYKLIGADGKEYLSETPGEYGGNGKPLRDMENIVQSIDDSIRSMRFRRDIHPTDMAPAIYRANRKLKLSCQSWGYLKIPDGGVIFNARTESVREKKLFSAGIQYHRAVIPAAHFYEWNASREKNTFRRQDGRTMFLAGFYDIIGNKERFVILTTQANDSMRSVHDRMPLVLEERQLEDWICDDRCTNRLLEQVPVLMNRQSEYEQMSLF